MRARKSAQQPARPPGPGPAAVPAETERPDHGPSVKEGWFWYVDAPPRPQPPRRPPKELAAMSIRDRALYEDLRSVWHANLGPIMTPQMRSIHDDLDEILESNRHDAHRTKGAAVLDAYPGLGKTTIAMSFGRAFHLRQIALHGRTTPDGHDRIPVVYIALTSNTTIRTVNSMLCRFYGLPGVDRGNALQLGNRANDCVLSCRTLLIIIDDVHFLDLSRRDSRETANHFKWMSTQFPVTFLFVGVGLRHRGLLTEGLSPSDAVFAQIARRWTLLSVDPFEIMSEEGRQTWRRLLLALEQMIVLAKKYPGMLADDLAGYVFSRSSGHFESLMTLINRGCRRAIRTGEERLTRELLDHVKLDAAAEARRRELEPAVDHGLLNPLPGGAVAG